MMMAEREREWKWREEKNKNEGRNEWVMNGWGVEWGFIRDREKIGVGMMTGETEEGVCGSEYENFTNICNL